MIFNNERHLTSLEHSNIRYQYDSSITNFYPDFKLTSLSLLFKMAAAVVSVSDIVENLTDNKGLSKDSCCKKCFDLETQLQEALKEQQTFYQAWITQK